MWFWLPSGGGSEADARAGAASGGSSSGGAGVGTASSAARVSPAAPKGPAPAVAPTSPSAEEQRRAELELWMKRLARAQHTLDSYVEATKYPHHSRPMSEQPDQVQPNAPIDRKLPFAKQGQRERPGSDTQLDARQERVFVVGDEAVRFSVAAKTGAGAPLPLQVTGAMVAPPPDEETMPPDTAPMPLAFTDDGQNGDDVAGDGVFTARLQPSKTGFARYQGALRVSVQMRAGEEEGETFFDIIYTPVPPATFTGKVREAVEGGSLELYLAVSVKKPGRYVVSGRVDDASGKPFALVTFNEELAEGLHEVKLEVFGKLIRDGKPVFPLTLRDVDAFLLKENVYPDRELLPRLMGRVYTTRSYAETVFSDAEWQSEERDRYVTELTKDVNQAKQEVATRQGP